MESRSRSRTPLASTGGGHSGRSRGRRRPFSDCTNTAPSPSSSSASTPRRPPKSDRSSTSETSRINVCGNSEKLASTHSSSPLESQGNWRFNCALRFLSMVIESIDSTHSYSYVHEIHICNRIYCRRLSFCNYFESFVIFGRLSAIISLLCHPKFLLWNRICNWYLGIILLMISVSFYVCWCDLSPGRWALDSLYSSNNCREKEVQGEGGCCICLLLSCKRA